MTGSRTERNAGGVRSLMAFTRSRLPSPAMAAAARRSAHDSGQAWSLGRIGENEAEAVARNRTQPMSESGVAATDTSGRVVNRAEYESDPVPPGGAHTNQAGQSVGVCITRLCANVRRVWIWPVA